MRAKIVDIPTTRITDWPTFHQVFSSALGFPEFYGQNLDAWIDCMTYVDEPDAGMSAVTVDAGELLILNVSEAHDFKRRCPTQFDALLECTAFVNYRRVETGAQAVLALILLGHFQSDSTA